MGTVPVTIQGTLTNQDGSTAQVTLTGDMWITGLSVGGGPILPPDKPPTDPGYPAFPIWGPPGSGFPPKPGYPPTAEHPIVIPPIPPIPPDVKPPDPPLFVPVWHPDLGWIMIPTFPIPAPSKGKK